MNDDVGMVRASRISICDRVHENQPYYVGEINFEIRTSGNLRHITSKILFFAPEGSLLIVEFSYLL